MGLFYYSITILAFYKMQKHGAQQQSPNQSVLNIVNLSVTVYIVQMIAETMSGADFLKHLAKSLDSIVRFHVDKIYKPYFVKLITPLLDAFSQLTDADFLHCVVKLLNEHLGPKGFVFSLSDADGTWRMTGAVAASAVYGGRSATSVVSEPHVARSFAAAVGGWCAAEAQPNNCRICLDGEKNHTFVPCGHLCVCASCAPKCKTCPICRVHVTSILQIFDS